MKRREGGGKEKGGSEGAGWSRRKRKGIKGSDEGGRMGRREREERLGWRKREHGIRRWEREVGLG